MAELNELVEMLSELDDQLVTCMRCGMCQAVCPVFKQSGRETDVTRGKLALLDGLAQKIIHTPEEVNESLYRCLLCGTCQANCPSGVEITDIFLKARAVLTTYLGLSPAKKALFRGLLARPKLMDSFLAIGSKMQGLFTKQADALLGSSCARIKLPVMEDRHFKALAPRALHREISPLDTAGSGDTPRVAIFTGCVVDKIFPNIGKATLMVLQHHKTGIYLPENQGCCGIPPLSSGDLSSFYRLVEHNLKLYKDKEFDYLITACATCTATIKELWPKMYAHKTDLKEDIERIAKKTMDISQFLTDVLTPEVRENTAFPVTYHDPCHLKNSLGIITQPRSLIQKSGYRYIEMKNADTCCGCGGSFNLVHYGTSRKIGMEKAENIISTQAKTVATSCPACMLQMTDMLSRKKAGIAVKHVVELYAEVL